MIKTSPHRLNWDEGHFFKKNIYIVLEVIFSEGKSLLSAEKLKALFQFKNAWKGTLHAFRFSAVISISPSEQSLLKVQLTTHCIFCICWRWCRVDLIRMNEQGPRVYKKTFCKSRSLRPRPTFFRSYHAVRPWFVFFLSTSVISAFPTDLITIH